MHPNRTSDLLVRLARPAEAGTIASLSRELIEHGLKWRWTPERVTASIRATNVNVAVACSGNCIAGFGIMRYGDDRAHLDLFAVAPPYRRSGVGRKLLQWLEKCAAVAGISSITLEVRASNEGAQLFYQKMGYQRLAHVPGYYQGVEAALRMQRQLACSPAAQVSGVEKTLERIFGATPTYLRCVEPPVKH
jgi:ribosomal protein S18 acetylase RimI-like enzyme